MDGKDSASGEKADADKALSDSLRQLLAALADEQRRQALADAAAKAPASAPPAGAVPLKPGSFIHGLPLNSGAAKAPAPAPADPLGMGPQFRGLPETGAGAAAAAAPAPAKPEVEAFSGAGHALSSGAPAAAKTADELRRARLQALGKAPAGGRAAAAPAPAAAAAAASAVPLPSAASPSSSAGVLAQAAPRPEPLVAPAARVPAPAAASASPSSAGASSVGAAAAPSGGGSGFVPNAELLSQLVAFDFDRARAHRALEATSNTSIAAAVDWMMMHDLPAPSAAVAPVQPQLLGSPSSAASASAATPTGSAAVSSAAAPIPAGPVHAAAGAAARRAIELMAAAEDRAAARLCAETIVTLCGNLLKDPGNPKYQSVNLANERIRERLLRVAGGIDAMMTGGWAKDEAANQLRMPDAAAAAPCLRAVVHELQAVLAVGGRFSA